MTYPTASEHLNVGKLRALATMSRTRIEPLPRGDDFAGLLRKQYNEFGTVIREANVKAEYHEVRFGTLEMSTITVIPIPFAHNDPAVI